MDAAEGIQSNINKLAEKNSDFSKWTIWDRILKSSNNVIYSGVFTTFEVPIFSGRLLKIIFPFPNGNATAIIKNEILTDGSLRLSSDGKKFGDNGFYFLLSDHNGKYWARFVRSMHEWITVYVDEENNLTANHNLHFSGLNFLKLHYKMTEKKNIEPIRAKDQPYTPA